MDSESKQSHFASLNGVVEHSSSLSLLFFYLRLMESARAHRSRSGRDFPLEKISFPFETHVEMWKSLFGQVLFVETSVKSV